ncbi:hypothetical protein [Butyrivibrio hungatei]|uniref:Uncharacterized protein n=1 Tax=Butyrivibrio hungatei TaxID=185008 RepID=A0A1D9P429_9FIRM|nr:hypothetical protein [Butyrivibrio hungatei]AOZ97289.1 hypothetical protein bhn_I2256 [Butyrivibrio hungatei]
MSIKYDAEKINEFNEDLEGTIDRYRTNAAYFTLSCEKYGANSTHVGKAAEASSHYVVITAIYEEKDIVGTSRIMLEISSWGKKYYVDYDQYIDFVSDNPHNKPFSSITNTSK